MKKLLAAILVAVTALSSPAVALAAVVDTREYDFSQVVEEEQLSAEEETTDEQTADDESADSFGISSFDAVIPSDRALPMSTEKGTDEIAETITSGSISYETTENSKWKDYSSYYIYNQLTKNERLFYDALMDESILYMEGGGDVEQDQWGNYVLPGISYLPLSADRAFEIFYLFKDNNSQFYYLHPDQRVWNDYFYPQVYPAFAKESSRREATEKFASELSRLENKATSKKGDYKKVKAVHDMICKKMKYSEDGKEDKLFLESSYSAIVKSKTQCGGYAKSFALVCNKLGLDAVVVGSNSHGWNLVKVNDVWYELDCTWDDVNGYKNEGGPIIYDWFLRSEKAVSRNEEGNDHVFTTLYKPYIPACTKDCAPSNGGLTPGKPSSSTAKAKAPKLTYVDGWFTLTADGADNIYFTLDGRTPEVGQDKSFIYSSPIQAELGTVVKAIAVKNPKRNSKEITWILGEPGYSVIEVSKDTLNAKTLKKKAQTIDISVTGSDGEVTVENTTENEALAKKVRIDGTKIIFRKKAKKGTYTFCVTVAGNAVYRETSEIITIKVK